MASKTKPKGKGLDYSVWDHIEISDDEDDTHPNVDTPSLFRWRHSARIERMEKEAKEKEAIKSAHTQHLQKMEEIRQKLKQADITGASDVQPEALKAQLSELEKQEEEWRKKEEELKSKEKLTPWNIDTICHEGKSKSIINKIDESEPVLSDEDRFKRQEAFTTKYEKQIKKFGMLQKYDDSQQFLSDNPHLACEETANYLVLWCINLEVEEKHDLMEHVCHQTIVMQFILELAKSLKVDPRACIRTFFARIKVGEKQYMDAFNDELEAFKGRVKDRAKARIEAAMAELEAEEKQKRLGPGGLDPVEVFDSLPKSLQECFESKDIALLQKTIAEMPIEEAQFHMKRCVDSGLWVPGKSDGAAESDDPTYAETEESN